MKYLSNINGTDRFGIPTRKCFEPTKYPREKHLDPQNTHGKKFWTHETPTRKNFGVTKYPREKILDPRNLHEVTKALWHNGTKPTRPNATH